MIEQHFGESGAFSVGAEEEFMVLEAQTLALAPRAARLVDTAAERPLPGVLKPELFASIVELTTGVCASAPEAVEALRELRRFAVEAAANEGLRVAAAGAHPFSPPEEQEIADDERYRTFVDYAGVSARRQGVCGLHVHVGMPSAADCMRALEFVLPWLPVVLALSANSPYVAGVETGLASNRAEILAQLPRSGAPPRFGTYDEWEALVERFVRTGLADDYTRFWWDVRPHPRFGTLEVRMPDQPTALARTAAFVALIQALCATALLHPERASAPGDRALYQQNRWAALRFGGAAELIHPSDQRLAAVPELTGELLALVEPAARELGTLELLAALDPPRPEGERQLEVGRARGVRAVAADLVDRTAR